MMYKKQLWKNTAVLACIMYTMLMTGCGAQSSSAPVTPRPEVIDHTGAYIVQPGDTLYSVAWQFGLDYRDIIALNNLKSPYHLYKGERLELARSRGTAPEGLGNPPIIVSHLPGNNGSENKKPVTTQKAAAPAPAPVAATTVTHTAWIWPTQGKVIKGFTLNGTTVNKGIDISGKAGQSIVAAANGDVVYSGKGIPGYGNLIIIKHNAAYLTAYAYNQQNLVHEGQAIKAGQKIATMGYSSNKQPELHFEMRYNGQPVDPLNYLPVHK